MKRFLSAKIPKFLFFALTSMMFPVASGEPGIAGRSVDLHFSSSSISVSAPPQYCVNTNFFASPESAVDMRVRKFFREANLSIVRFPGGLGNWYDWKSGEIAAGTHQIFKFMRGREFSKVSLSEIKWQGVKGIVYVVSPFDSSSKVAALVKRWSELQLPVKWVEIGNEMYTRRFASEIGGAEGYLRLARQTKASLRKAGYRGKVGVVLAPVWTPGKERHPHRALWDAWNETLQVDGLRDFDAVIVHFYPLLKRLGFSKSVALAPSAFRSMVSSLRKEFPGKEVWITEWNMGGPASDKHFNTLAHALFVLDMMQAMDEMQVELACYHVLTGRGWELLGPDRFALRDSPQSRINLLRRVPYFAVQLHQKAMLGGRLLESGTRYGIHYLAFDHNGLLELLLWGRDRKSLTVNVILNGGRMKFVGGDALHGSLDANNGSLLGYLKHWPSMKDQEMVKPASLLEPRVTFPGIARLRFAATDDSPLRRKP